MALVLQDLPVKDFEVIVVDDGSRDKTKHFLSGFVVKHENFRFFSQKNKGQGIARNLGTTKAKGNIIVFIGDDIIVKKNFLSQHLRFHLGMLVKIVRFWGLHPGIRGLRLLLL